MVVHISTIDEVRDMLIKLNINERDVHKVLSSLQMRENWLQYLSQKIEDGTETARQTAALDHDEIDGNLDTMIRQHSDPSSPNYKPDLLSSSGFLGETYTPAVANAASTTHSRENPSFSSSESRHKRETHVCNTLGPNPKVMIAHMGTKEMHDDSLPVDQPTSLVHPRSSTVSSTNSLHLLRTDAFATVEESIIEDDENSSAAASLRRCVERGGKITSSSSSTSSSHSSSLDYATSPGMTAPKTSSGYRSPEHILVKDLSATHIPPDIRVYVVSSAPQPPNPKFCVNVMTESLKKKVLSTSGLAFFTRSCAMRARQ